MTRIYTDGSCLQNPGGPGGWGVVIIHERDNRTDYETFSGFDPNTTNNRMEMQAVIEGLKRVEGDVQVFSDSLYVINSMMGKWKRKANIDLWLILDGLVQGRKVEWTFVRGHNGDLYNELADQAATSAARTGKPKKQPSDLQPDTYYQDKLNHQHLKEI